MTKKLVPCFALPVILFAMSVLSLAQVTAESSVKGNLTVIVTDPSGAVIDDAKVVVSGPNGERTINSDRDGKALFGVLIPGFYSVKISKEGFKSADLPSAEVQTGRTSTVSVKMEVGTSSVVVEVSASAIAVDTTSTAVSSNLTDNFYSSVPVGRGVTSLFYAAPGVAAGGGTGTANPSISGGTGLENNYVADGVSITDGGFGGIGVYSRVYGSLSTGINLSFVKEVQVKTGGYEAQYGKSTGGIVQIVTKTGSDQFHGSVGGYFAPQQVEMQRRQTDNFGLGGSDQRFNLQGKILHQSNYDVDAQLGGPVPGFRKHLFFYGSFNPQWNTDYNEYAQFHNPSDLGTGGTGGATQTHLGNFQVPVKVYSYAGKGTWRLGDMHQIEASLFGDPSYGQFNANGNFGPQTASTTTFDKLQYGTRNFVARYNGTLSPTWLMNASWSWGHNHLNDTPLNPSIYNIVDLVQRNPCNGSPANGDCTSPNAVLRGQFTRQGLGYFENTKGDNYGLNADTSKTFRFAGVHNLSFGYRYDRSHYDGSKFRTGANISVDPAIADAFFDPADPAQAPIGSALKANGTNATFQLRPRGGDSCIGGAFQAEIYIPGLANCPDGGEGVNLRNTRGEFGKALFKTTSLYHTVFAQDSWSVNKYVTINAGIRWEQQHVQGVNAGYTFNDNWSPRLGLSVDPWGNRKSKIYANFGRYTESLPLDIAIRSLSAEFDFSDSNWVPPTDGAGHVVLGSDGIIDLSTLEGTRNPANPAHGYIRSFNAGAAAQASVAFGAKTRSEYLDEYVVGFEHEFGNSGVIFTARYTDRRIRRIIEDLAALSPEASEAGLTQQYLIGNPSKTTDYFTNPIQNGYNHAAGGSCPVSNSAGDTFAFNGGVTDSNGNSVTNTAGNDNMCITGGPYANGANPGDPVADGTPDGFVNPARNYKAMEFEVNKSLSRGWQMRANYRIAKLLGNYEGSFRNDNGQNDPNISSLFDFTRGDWNLLGQQFVPGVLNTDVRHLVNGFVSYTFSGKYLKGATMGAAAHFQTGIPINNLYSHPVYANAGEIPFCADNTTNCASARGALGRTSNFGGADYKFDYPVRVTEKARLHLAADLFNITNQRTQLRVDQFYQRTVGVLNADFGKPTGIGPSAVNGNTNPAYQRPFYARFSAKLEF